MSGKGQGKRLLMSRQHGKPVVVVPADLVALGLEARLASGLALAFTQLCASDPQVQADS